MGAEQKDAPVLSVEAANQQGRDALIRARAHLGLRNRVDFARLMNELTGQAGPDWSSYNRWENGEQKVPAWALIVAARVAGVSVDQLLSSEPSSEELRPEDLGRLYRVEKELKEVVTLVKRLDQRERAERSRKVRSKRSATSSG